MKFKTPARGAVLGLLALAGVHVLLKTTEISLSQNWLSTALSVALVLLSCGLYIGVHFLRERMNQRETLEIGRRGFQITQPGTVPFALSWRMIRTASLIPGDSAEWRFDLKNGGKVALREAQFTREQWKKISVQLERKFKARKIPMRVGAPGASPPSPSVRDEPRLVDGDVLREIRDCVREASHTEERLIAIFLGEKYRPGELDPAEVVLAVRRAIADQKEEEKSWPPETDNDRLTRVFSALTAAGILSIENLGWTEGDGYHEIHELYKKEGSPSRIFGYCFYHSQDLEGAVQGRPLYLAFGPMDPQWEQRDGVRIGKVIREELLGSGFQVTWNETLATRLRIDNLIWRKRLR